MVRILLRAEGLIVFLISLYFYGAAGGNWILFIALLFIPDVSMIGYLRDKKIGAFTYNLAHNYVLSLLTIFAGIYSSSETLIQLGLILTAHVAMDRFLGFGLKYPSDFKDTHVQKV